MSVSRVILISAICLLLGAGLGFLGGTRVGKIPMAEQPNTDRAPIRGRIVTIAIDEGQTEQLLAQLRSFADKWRYAIRIDPVKPVSENFRVAMWRSDMKVLGAYLVASRTLQIAFTDTESTRPVPERYFDEEVTDLQGYIAEIPGATFSVDK